jgi:hypothetical protein
MEGVLVFLGVICCLVVFGSFISVFVILGRTGTILENVEAMQKKLISLGKEISLAKLEILKLQSGPINTEGKTEEKIVIVNQQIITPPVIIPEERKEEIIIPEIKQEIIINPPPILPPVEEEVDEYERPPLASYENKIVQPEEKPIQNQTVPAEKKNTPPPPPSKPGFFERNPDLEKFIGENLINKIGIAILVIGIGFFVKFAIDKDWINEIGRVFIGILCGGILVGFAHYTRNSFRSFSSVLVGGGMAIFYLTIAIAFHSYGLMSKEVAFGIMVLITVFSVALAIAYDRKELAVLAIIGGFASPFMVSTGDGNYKILFSYILILNIGMLVLSYFKRWNIVNVISFVFTILLFGGWLLKVFSDPTIEPKPYSSALVFATLFYLVFFSMNIINNVKENKKFLAFEISILIANTFLYYSAGMVVMKNIQNGFYQGLFTVLIAVFNFVFAYLLYKNNKVDKNLVYLLIGLVLTFVTLAAPIQLQGNYITLFWAAETVLLLWLSQKSGIKIMKLASFIIMGLMIISLIMDWNNIYANGNEIIPIVFNKGFITSLVALASITATILLLKNEEGEELLEGFDKKTYAAILEFLFVVISYASGLLEVYFQFKSRLVEDPNAGSIIPLYTGCYNLAYIIMISAYIQFKKIKWMELIPVFFSGLISLAYLVYYNRISFDVRNSYILGEQSLAFHYLFHYINVILLLLILINALRIMAARYTKTDNEFNYFLWFVSIVLVFVASVELENVVLISSYSVGMDLDVIKHHNYKVGFPILWGVCSFAMMVIGMKMKIKTLRIISLTLFGIALLKMFIFDIREMSEGGKIAAFISLGILLLIISFMYQKVKKILTEE